MISSINSNSPYWLQGVDLLLDLDDDELGLVEHGDLVLALLPADGQRAPQGEEVGELGGR